MEDLPTLHGPRNRTMGFEVISLSAQVVTQTESQSDGLKRGTNILYRVPFFKVSACNSNTFSKALPTFWHCAHRAFRLKLWWQKYDGSLFSRPLLTQCFLGLIRNSLTTVAGVPDIRTIRLAPQGVPESHGPRSRSHLLQGVNDTLGTEQSCRESGQHNAAFNSQQTDASLCLSASLNPVGPCLNVDCTLRRVCKKSSFGRQRRDLAGGTEI